MINDSFWKWSNCDIFCGMYIKKFNKTFDESDSPVSWIEANTLSSQTLTLNIVSAGVPSHQYEKKRGQYWASVSFWQFEIADFEWKNCQSSSRGHVQVLPQWRQCFKSQNTTGIYHTSRLLVRQTVFSFNRSWVQCAWSGKNKRWSDL